MLECKNERYLTNFYERFGFTMLEREYKENEFLQFIRILSDNELIEKKDETEEPID